MTTASYNPFPVFPRHGVMLGWMFSAAVAVAAAAGEAAAPPSKSTDAGVEFRYYTATIVVARADGAPVGPQPSTMPSSKAESAGAAVEIRFNDGSTLKVTVLDAHLNLTTPYGKLHIPIADIQQIDFASRVSDAVAKEIRRAVSDLGSSQFRRRESASAYLLQMRERAYPALQCAAKQKDPEVARRAEELLNKLRETTTEDQLQIRKHDVVCTQESRFTGKIEEAAWNVSTSQFGVVHLKLADMREARSLAPESGAGLVAPDPGSLVSFEKEIGKSFLFRVTGSDSGSLWGTDAYTSDSSLAAAAVHSGALQVGQTGIVRIIMMPPPTEFQGSTRNGVTSLPHGTHRGAYRISR